MFTQVVRSQIEEGLGVFQLATAGQNTLEYIGAGKAMAERAIEVTEVSEAGSVNRLKVINHSERYVFFMEGDLLEGAKQNRVLNTSVFLAPHSTTIIPVSCVEAGRWHRTSATFNAAPFVYPAFMRQMKAEQVTDNLHKRRAHMANQNEVWESITLYSSTVERSSPTADFISLFGERQRGMDRHAAFIRSPHGSPCGVG